MADEQHCIVTIVTCDPEQTIKLLGIPIVGTIEPQPDPVYGHVFKMPEAVIEQAHVQL